MNIINVMKPVNLISLISVYATGDAELLGRYTGYHGIGTAQGGMRTAEMEDIISLIDDMEDERADDEAFDNYFVGYSIPQIGKEFDLLRFGKDSVIDIEIKRSATSERAEKQLRQNAYYLSFLADRKKFLFSYVCDTKKVYRWNGSKAEECPLSVLTDSIEKQGYFELKDIDSLFNPANYLVSPFNSTEAFVRREYFLTKQQEDIKRKVFSTIERGKSRFIAITGKPGTGKTLLLYDIVADLKDAGKRVLIIHSGILNYGQQKLMEISGWEIISAKRIQRYNLDNYDVVVVDESQRIYPSQFKEITESIARNGSTCIFSYDENQCLRDEESAWDNAGKIRSMCANELHELKDKIRTNREVAEFIRRLLEKGHPYAIGQYPNVSISFCTDCRDAKAMLTMLQNQGWCVPVYTPSQFEPFGYERYSIRSQSAHEVVGQEFDNVVAVIDSDFQYDNNGRLCTCKTSDSRIYNKYKMFYQIISRTRQRLHILFIDNREVFSHCLGLLS